MGGADCSQAVYTVDNEGFEEDCTVGGGAGQLVNHSYSRGDTSGETTRGRGMRGRRGTTQTDIARGRSRGWKDKRKESSVLKFKGGGDI